MSRSALHSPRLLLTLALATGALFALSCDLPVDVEPPLDNQTASCYDYGALTVIEAAITGFYADIEVVDGYAYLGSYPIVVMDMNTEGVPSVIDEVPASGYAMTRTSTGICAASGSRLWMIGVSDTDRGKILGQLNFPFFTRDVAAVGRYAYLVDETGLWVIDTVDPAAPRIAGSVSLPERPIALAAFGHNAAVTTENGLWIIDVTNPASPQRVAELKDERSEALEFIAGYLVTAVGSSIGIIDVTDPAAPVRVRTLNLGGPRIRDIAFDGSRAFLGGDGLTVVNLTRPTSPTIISQMSGIYARSVAVDRDRAYLAGDRGLVVVKVSNTRRPAPLTRINAQGTAVHTALQSPLTLVAGSVLGLWVMDLRTSTGIIGRLPMPGAYDVCTDSTYAYVASRGLVVARAETTLAPRIVSRLDLPGESMAIALENRRAYLAQSRFGLWIVDIADPLAPRTLGSVDTPFEAMDVVVRGDWAWVADRAEGLLTIDASNPASPRIVDRIPHRDARALALSGPYLYMVTERGLFQTIDISSPARPEIVSKQEGYGRLFDVTVAGDVAYLAGDMGVLVMDVSHPDSPEMIGTADEEGAFGVMVDAVTDRVYVTNGDLKVIRPQCLEATRGGRP